MKKNKILILSLFIFGILLAFGFFGGLFGAGSYPYAQKYKLEESPKKLIKTIKELKITLPGNDSTIDSYDHSDEWSNFHIYIYSSKSDEIIHMFVENSNNDVNEANLYLVGLNKGKNLGNWKIINSDFNRKDNIEKKNQFVELVFSKLNLKYQDKGNSMFVFWK